MPWVRFDDQFPIHRKVSGLSDAAFRLHVTAIHWCARNLTDGFVPRPDIDDVCARVRTPARFAAECVDRGTWHDATAACPSGSCPAPVDNPDGWVIHDYWEYQPRREKVIATKAARAESGRKGGIASGETRRSQPYGSKPEANSFDFASRSLEPRPGPVPVVVADVVNRTNGSKPHHADITVIDAIIKEIHDQTGKLIDPDWAQRVADHLLQGQPVANPAAYVRQCIRNEPDPAARFLPHARYARHARTESQ